MRAFFPLCQREAGRQVTRPSRSFQTASVSKAHPINFWRLVLVVALLSAALGLTLARARSAIAFGTPRLGIRGCGLIAPSLAPCSPASPSPASPSVVALSDLEARTEAGTQAVFLLEFIVLLILNIGLLFLFHKARRKPKP